VVPELRKIPLNRIRVPDVRVSSILDEEQRALLDSTIKEVGVVQDPVVRTLPGGDYELVAGRSRISALAAQGATEIQAKVIDADAKTGLIMNVIENVARGSYDYVSIAQAIRRLRELGSTPEELEKVFPWKRRWIEFLEQLQDLPDDVVDALRERRLTPTHVQLALNLTTPEEVHSALRSAVTLGWDSGTLRIFAANRLEQIQRAQQDARERGVASEIPPPNPEQLVRYRQCLVCGYQKPAEKVTLQNICEGCVDLAKYVTGLEGTPEEAINVVYEALRMYHGVLATSAPSSASSTEARPRA
jgi:ParB/RepB/Spo0J family partition protein